ncbi:MAG: hypothetical protein GXP28_01025 [Planctomycetes bacterium]|nr:hypothetical protein [Planctomycetota bacterium]
MANPTARMGRRRRVLKEEVLTASSALREDLVCTPGDTPRYGAGANIENHPQVTDLVPRKFRSIALVLGLGLLVGLLAELAAHNSENLSSIVPVISATEITTVFSNQLIAWASAAILLAAACYTKLIFSLRRHRVDDVRGRYRMWKTASWAAIALSLNTVVGGHAIVARILGYFTPWNLLPENAGWWLAGAAILGGTLLLKLILDVAECRAAMVVYGLALGCFVVAGAGAAGWSPVWAASWPDTIGRALPLAGNLMLLVGSLLFARYVVLDVQGLIEHRATPPKQPVVSEQVPPSEEVEPEQSTKGVIANESAWIDGSEGESEDDGTRRLSKSERKRLRKQKSRNRAA